MGIPENEETTGGVHVEKPVPDQDAADVPGMQKIVTNPNPRANANVPDAAADTNQQDDDNIEEVGSEITDGEGG